MAASARPDHAFVWVWLPGATTPVVAGRLDAAGDVLLFTYGRSYLQNPNAIPLYLPELPLRPGRIRPAAGLTAPGCIRDSAPDAWGQRVILARQVGRLTRDSDTGDLSLLTYLLDSGSDRVGGLDFQHRADVYEPRESSATLAELQSAAQRLIAGEPLTAALDLALLHGTSIGGARPKVLVTESAADGDRHLIAKLSSQTDPYPVVKAEGAAMELAGRVGLTVPRTQVIESLGRDVLLVERFDREADTGQRRLMVSALTLLELDDMTGRYATYHELADQIRRRFADPGPTLRELFSRIVFNICVGNTDDHARNHAAFWDGELLRLTPAYDLCPQLRSGTEANQAMAIGRGGERESRFAVCVAAAESYHLSHAEGQEIVDAQVTTIREQWDAAADAARLTTQERRQLWERQILNPFAFT